MSAGELTKRQGQTVVNGANGPGI